MVRKKKVWKFTATTRDGSPAPGGPLLNPSNGPSVTIATYSRAENRDRRWRCEVLGGMDVSIERVRD